MEPHPAGQCWSEGWTEDYRSDGIRRSILREDGLARDGAAPEDGHANRWTEKWGEKWDGKGGCIKWTDTWASRDHAEGGMSDAPLRGWGEKWEEKWGGSYNHDGRVGDATGCHLGRDGRRTPRAHVGRGTLPGRSPSQVRKQLGREPVLGRVVRRRRRLVGAHAELRLE